jgi:hypothetical protein
MAGLFLFWGRSSLAGAATRPFANIKAFREFVMAALRKRAGVTAVVADPADQAKFHFTAGGRSGIGDVTNLFGYVRSYPKDFDVSVGRFLNSTTEALANAGSDENIAAVIRTRDYVSGGGASFLHEPLGADLVVVYMADRPDSMSPLSPKDVPGQDLASVHRIALNNLRRWLPKVVADNQFGFGTLYYVEGDTMLSPSLILSDDFWKSVARRFPKDVLIALPRKDQLFIFDDDGNPATRARVRRLIKVTLEDNFNLLSPQLYARRGGKIVPVDD